MAGGELICIFGKRLRYRHSKVQNKKYPFLFCTLLVYLYLCGVNCAVVDGGVVRVVISE